MKIKEPEPYVMPPQIVVRRFFELKPLTDLPDVVRHAEWISKIKNAKLPPISCPASEATPKFTRVEPMDARDIFGPLPPELQESIRTPIRRLSHVEMQHELVSYDEMQRQIRGMRRAQLQLISDEIPPHALQRLREYAYASSQRLPSE